MFVEVYHNKHFLDQHLLLAQPLPVKPEHYSKVATVACASLDEAYRLTNHIERPWCENAGVICYQAHPRSTSVSDVLVDETGQAWIVERVGFGLVTAQWQRSQEHEGV